MPVKSLPFTKLNFHSSWLAFPWACRLVTRNESLKTLFCWSRHHRSNLVISIMQRRLFATRLISDNTLHAYIQSTWHRSIAFEATFPHSLHAHGSHADCVDVHFSVFSELHNETKDEGEYSWMHKIEIAMQLMGRLKAEHHRRMTLQKKTILEDSLKKHLNNQLKVIKNCIEQWAKLHRKSLKFSGNCENIAIESCVKRREDLLITRHGASCSSFYYCTKLQPSFVMALERLPFFLRQFFGPDLVNDTKKSLHVMFTSLCLALSSISYAHLNEMLLCHSYAAIFCPRHKGDGELPFADKWLCTQ